MYQSTVPDPQFDRKLSKLKENDISSVTQMHTKCYEIYLPNGSSYLAIETLCNNDDRSYSLQKEEMQTADISMQFTVS